MKNKTVTITLIALLTLSSFGLFFTSLLTPAASAYSFQPLEEIALMDLTHENFAEKEALASEVEPIESPSGQPAEVGDDYIFEVSDDYLGVDYDEDFVVVAEGDHILILVTLDAYNFYLAEGFYNFSNPIGNNSEAWLRYGDIITTEMVDYMVDEFDNNIYPSMAAVYGVPASRPSDILDPEYDDRDKIWTLIFNIKDLAYYDPDADSYIAGYFSLSDSNTNQKNIMHIDSFEWIRRCGDADTPWFDVDHPRARPNLYESTFAHEYEHMIHSDIDADEPSWVDEGLADLSGYICGYGHPDGHLMYYMAFHPFTSLTFWGSGLEDYGCSYLFQLYLFEKYGGAAFVTDLVQEQANGIEGIVKTLRKHGCWYPFDWIFDWWTIANYLDDTSIYGGRYGYDLLDIGSADTRGWTLDYALWGYWGEPIFSGEWEIDVSWWWGNPQPYTPHYYRFTTDARSKIYIDGEVFAGTTAYSGTYEWYSDAQAWTWRSFYQTFAIPAGGATLDFMTYYEIEGDWDYGYVEVYDQDTGEWYTLEAAGTVDYVAHAQDNPNTPDGREPTDYETAGRWHAFTGASGGWIPVSMDLTPFAGHDIDVYFTLWQDGAFTLQNMYVDDISIPEIGFSDDVEAGEAGWATTGWYVTDGIQNNDWEVTILGLDYPITDPEVPIGFRWVRNVYVSYATQSGSYTLSTSYPDQVYLAIVSNRADHILPSNYVVGVEHKSFIWYW